MKPFSLVPILLAAAVVAVPASPQDEQVLASGDELRIIVQGSNSRYLRATVMEVQPDALLVRTSADGQPRRIALSGVSSLEVARGRRGHFGDGFRIGFVPGALSGGILGLNASCGDGASNCEARVGLAVIGAAICGAATGLLGGLIGGAVQTDRWVPVPTPAGRGPSVGVGVMPARGGVAARLTVAF